MFGDEGGDMGVRRGGVRGDGFGLVWTAPGPWSVVSL